MDENCPVRDRRGEMNPGQDRRGEVNPGTDFHKIH
jgi:hypothetical protein